MTVKRWHYPAIGTLGIGAIMLLDNSPRWFGLFCIAILWFYEAWLLGKR